MEGFDVVVMGSGPAGLQASLHAVRRAGVLVFGRLEASNLWRAKIENYLSVSYPILGQDLLLRSKERAIESGVRFAEEDVLEVEIRGEEIVVKGESRQVNCKSLIIACGVSHRRLGVPGEKEFLGRGVSYCADCDCMFFRGKVVAVVGDGSAALRAVDLLSRFASKVYWIWPEIKIGEDKKRELAGKGIELILADVKEIQGEDKVNSVLLDSGMLSVDGVFVELGARGISELAMEIGLMLDPKTMQFVQVDRAQKTNIRGIFACGDVTGPPLQLAKAVGEGCVAGTQAGDFVRTGNW